MALSKLLVLVFAAASALGTTFSPQRFAVTSWDTPASSAGVRLYGTNANRSGILELRLDGQFNTTSTAPLPWRARVRVADIVTTADGSDFAAISTQGGTELVIFFIRSDGILVYAHRAPPMESFSVSVVADAATPAVDTSLGAAMWGPGHMSVFYQDTHGIVFESEYANGTWATPFVVTNTRFGTDLGVVASTDGGALLKALYIQRGTRMAEFLWTKTTSWFERPIPAFPPQSMDINIRFAVSWIANDSLPGRIYYRGTDGKIGELRASGVSRWRAFGDLTNVNNTSPATEIVSSLQFSGGATANWAIVAYTALDGTLWHEVYRASAGWAPAAQIVTP
ncbi:hypothetical protein EXIGLDRAFT_836439 [Exidia glandulosa HHB12029]|uniref:Uncharacterized protein n=1 Tax=Exidia glandulosa HHB12029 TaxID=1314781 RepID=A0A165HT35_EXIGL|nr:hypothetical protein EXIGLDRAFT_836439 [Exidia glandulosa HHB12029]